MTTDLGRWRRGGDQASWESRALQSFNHRIGVTRALATSMNASARDSAIDAEDALAEPILWVAAGHRTWEHAAH